MIALVLIVLTVTTPLRAQSTRPVVPAEVVRYGDATDAAMPTVAVLGARLMTEGRVALLVATSQGQRVLVRDQQRKVIAQWPVPNNDASGQLAVHAESVFVAAGAVDDLRLLVFVIGKSAVAGQRPVEAQEERGLTLRGGPNTPVSLLFAPRRTGVPGAASHRAEYSLLSRDGSWVNALDDRTRVPVIVRSGGRTTTLFLIPPWESATPVDARSDALVVGRPATGRLELLSVGATVPRVIQIKAERTPLDSTAAANWRAEWGAQLRRASVFPDSIVNVAMQVPTPPFRPLFRAVFETGANEFLIVRDDLHQLRPGAGDPVILEFVGLDGAIRARVTLPTGSAIRDYVDGEILVVQADRARTFPLKREAPPQPAAEVVRYRIPR